MLTRSPSLLLLFVAPFVVSLPAEELAGVPVTVLSRSVVEVPGGTVTYLRIRPPLLPSRPAPPPAAAPVSLSPEIQAAMERAEAKPFAMLAVTATVFTRPDDSAAVTELTWRDGERLFRVWSNADFRLLRQLTDIETETHRFQWFPFIDVVPLAEVPPEQRPAGLALFSSASAPDALPEYYLEGTATDAAEVEPELGAFDWLHAHYHINRAQLAADLFRREAEAAEQAHQAAEAAVRPKAEKVYFWKIR